MTSEFKPRERYFDYFENDFDHIILSTFQYDRGFIEDELIPVLTGKTSIKDQNDRLEVMDALQNKVISIIATANIDEQRNLLGYDLIPYNGTQHSKIAILSRKDLIRIIIGSVNLTKKAFCNRLEAFCVLDFTKDCNLPQKLATEILDYINLISDGKGRISQQIKTINSYLGSMRLKPDWKNRSTKIKFLSYPPVKKIKDKHIIGQLFHELGNGKIHKIKVLTPFFEKEGCSFFEYFINETRKRGASNIGIYFPSITCGDDKKWLIIADKSLLEVAARHANKDVIRFFPIQTITDGQRDIHAKVIFVGTDKANYLLVGSSNLTKKGLGFPRVLPNAEANLLFRAPNPKEKTLRDFIPSNIAEQKIEIKDLFPIQADKDEDNCDDINLIPNIIDYAEYKNKNLTIGLYDHAKDKKNWAIFWDDHLLMDSKKWDGSKIIKNEISIAELASKPLDLKLKIGGVSYFYPIYFDEIQQLIQERCKKISISTEGLILFWLDRVSRPNVDRKLKSNTSESNPAGSATPIDTSDLWVNKVKSFIRALDGVKEFLREEKIVGTKMLENRIYGIYGTERAFEIINGINDNPTKLFCYSEMYLVIKDILTGFKDRDKKRILRRYAQTLKKRISKLKGKGLPHAWEVYLNKAGV